MRTFIPEALLQESGVKVAESVLRACIHCGFCNATCPTYALTGNELEGPRGRIYLIKGVLEGTVETTAKTVEHIDSCLGCLACETTCPSGVSYSHLLEEARPRLEAAYRRPLAERLNRWLLIRLLPHPGRFRLSMRLAVFARALKFLVPKSQRHLLEMAPGRLPPRATIATPGTVPAQGKKRHRMLLLTGCVQQVLGSRINDATARLLSRRGVEVRIPPEMGCCGALTFHMGERDRSLKMMRHNINVWYDEIAGGGLDAIVLNTSGCATAVREYDHIFRDDPQMADKARTVTALVRDVSEVIAEIGLGEVSNRLAARVAYHDACSLQHGQKIKAEPRALLRQAGCELVEVTDAHMCCGSAGTYNILQPENAAELLRRKAANINQTEPDLVAAGNIGCIEHISAGVGVPVVHTVELLDWATGGPRPSGIL